MSIKCTNRGFSALTLSSRIAHTVPTAQLKDLHRCATTMGMAVLIEAHSDKEIESASEMGANLIVIHNRDLVISVVNTERSIRLRTPYGKRRLLSVKAESLAQNMSAIFKMQDSNPFSLARS